MAIIRKFGKLAPRIDKRTLKLERYLTAALAPPPPRVDWTRGFDFNWGEFLNDQLGDCTEAKKGHAVQIWTLCNGRLVTVPDSVVLAAYEADGGYVPGNPSTDNGEAMIDNLNDWRQNGFGGYPLNAYAAIDFGSFAAVQQAIYLFGFVDIGFNVPQSALDQNAQGLPWTVVPNDGGIQGGHDVIVPMYDAASEMLTCITWSQRQMMSWEFFHKYVDESYALLSAGWISTRNDLDPAGLDLAALEADLAIVTA